jgi:hypothetical protein
LLSIGSGGAPSIVPGPRAPPTIRVGSLFLARLAGLRASSASTTGRRTQRKMAISADKLFSGGACISSVGAGRVPAYYDEPSTAIVVLCAPVSRHAAARVARAAQKSSAHPIGFSELRTTQADRVQGVRCYARAVLPQLAVVVACRSRGDNKNTNKNAKPADCGWRACRRPTHADDRATHRTNSARTRPARACRLI